MYLLFLNDMRGAHCEHTAPAVRADTLEQLWAFLQTERVPGGYKDVNESQRTGSHDFDQHGTNQTWGKTFKKGGPLEWYNSPYMLDLSASTPPSTLEDWQCVKTLPSREEWMESSGEEWDSIVSGLAEAPEA